MTRQKFLDTMILSNWSVNVTGLSVLLLSLSALSSVRLFEDCPEGKKLEKIEKKKFKRKNRAKHNFP